MNVPRVLSVSPRVPNYCATCGLPFRLFYPQLLVIKDITETDSRHIIEPVRGAGPASARLAEAHRYAYYEAPSAPGQAEQPDRYTREPRPAFLQMVGRPTVVPAGLISAIDGTSVGIAIPSMMTNLRADLDHIQWVVTTYLLIQTLLMPMTGWLTALLGRRNLFQ